MPYPPAEMLPSQQDLLLHQVAQVEVTITPQAEAVTAQVPIVPQAAHLTTGLQEQIRIPDPPLRMVEVGPRVTILEVRQTGLQILPASAPRVDQVQEAVTAPQVEVQADPQAAQAQEDPEEGGINSPFFLENLSENTHNFVTNPT